MKISKSMLSKVCISAAFVLSVTSVSADIIIRKDDPVPPQPPQPRIISQVDNNLVQNITVQLNP